MHAPQTDYSPQILDVTFINGINGFHLGRRELSGSKAHRIDRGPQHKDEDKAHRIDRGPQHKECIGGVLFRHSDSSIASSAISIMAQPLHTQVGRETLDSRPTVIVLSARGGPREYRRGQCPCCPIVS